MTTATGGWRVRRMLAPGRLPDQLCHAACLPRRASSQAMHTTASPQVPPPPACSRCTTPPTQPSRCLQRRRMRCWCSCRPRAFLCLRRCGWQRASPPWATPHAAVARTPTPCALLPRMGGATLCVHSAGCPASCWCMRRRWGTGRLLPGGAAQPGRLLGRQLALSRRCCCAAPFRSCRLPFRLRPWPARGAAGVRGAAPSCVTQVPCLPILPSWLCSQSAELCHQLGALLGRANRALQVAGWVAPGALQMCPASSA